MCGESRKHGSEGGQRFLRVRVAYPTSYLHERRNWGRWGKDDQVGALNLITPAKRVKAASLVRTGRSISLSRDFPIKVIGGTGSPANPIALF